MNFGAKLNAKAFANTIFPTKNLINLNKTYTHFMPIAFPMGKHEQLNKLKVSNSILIKNCMSNLYPVQIKKRTVKKKKIVDDSVEVFRVSAFSTSEEYDLEAIVEELPKLTPFKSTTFNSECRTLADAVHLFNNYSDSKNQHLFFFRSGSVVMWNVSDIETKSILSFLKNHEDNSFPENLVENESEFMPYFYSSDVKDPKILNEKIIFSEKENEYYQKFAISNAMALSVHLGTFEANLEEYIDSVEPVTEELRSGSRIKMNRNEVLKKTGQLFALRHNINLNSDFLDTPDFYWDREELENIYLYFCNYFCINKRTKVMNEKLNHCIELVDLLSTHLNDKHHTRLEWMIIILIMVEVGFEILHYLEKLTETNNLLPKHFEES